jgi:hypothetical protein
MDAIESKMEREFDLLFKELTASSVPLPTAP